MDHSAGYSLLNDSYFHAGNFLLVFRQLVLRDASKVTFERSAESVDMLLLFVWVRTCTAGGSN